MNKLTTIGDFNGDGLTDYMLAGNTQSYIVFGPMNLTNLESARDVANIVIDSSALGRPADRFGDIDGDGLADLAFVLDTGANIDVNIIFGKLGAAAAWPRNWNAQFVQTYLTRSSTSGNSALIRLNGNSLSDAGSLSVQIFETNADDKDDLLITSSSTYGTTEISTGTPDSFARFGYVFSGNKITNFQPSNANPRLTEADALASLDVNARPVLSSLASVITPAQLVHRYNFRTDGGFTGTQIVDSIGGLHGTIVDRTGSVLAPGGGGFTRNGLGVRLFGGNDATADYIALPDDMLSGLTDATFELWGRGSRYRIGPECSISELPRVRHYLPLGMHLPVQR